MANLEEIKRTLTLEQHRARMRQDSHAKCLRISNPNVEVWVYGLEATEIREAERKYKEKTNENRH